MTYTESDFIACLLVYGWVRFHISANSQLTYWGMVDMWFKKMWPERFIPEQREWVDDRDNPRDPHRGQMEFKIQFWWWGKKQFNTPVPISHRTKGAPRTGL